MKSKTNTSNKTFDQNIYGVLTNFSTKSHSINTYNENVYNNNNNVLFYRER